MATKKKPDAKDPVKNLELSRYRQTGPGLSPEELAAYQVRFDAERQPAAERRGRVTNAELYSSEKRLGEEMIFRHMPKIIAEGLRIATGQATEFVVNHKTGEVVEIPVNPRTQAWMIAAMWDRAWGKPETIKHVTEEVSRQETLTILIGPAADEAEARRVSHEAEFAIANPDEPLRLPVRPPEELAALPEVYTDRAVRQVMLASVLDGDTPQETRARVHEEVGTRDERRARRHSPGDTSP